MTMQTIGSSLFETSRAQARAQARAKYPSNSEGKPYCVEHDYVVPDSEWGCPTCREIREREQQVQRARATRLAEVERWFTISKRAVDGLGGLPAWEWAHFENAEWVKRCDKRVVAALRRWDPAKESIAVFAGTGSGKTSGFIASMAAKHAAVVAVAQEQRHRMPPEFLYVTGYEIGEASKRRRLGHPQHEVIEAATSRPLLILDEIHPSHSPAEVVFAILDARTRAGRVTAIGAGMSATEFGTAYGAAALRRVIEGGRLVDTFAKGGAR